MKQIIIILLVSIVFTQNTFAQQKKIQKLIGRPEEHFTLFWAKFKKAIIANDSDAVSRMVAYPFADGNAGNVGNYGLICKDETDFLQYYSELFPQHVKDAIKNDKYRGFDPTIATDRITKEQYLLQPSTDKHPPLYNYIFSKVKGIYKMISNSYNN